jgi:SH3 domain protein
MVNGSRRIAARDSMEDRSSMPRRLIAVVLLLLALPAAAETRYISDLLTVPLRSGPSLRHKILHPGLTSGTRLEILTDDPDTGFTQVRLTDGTEGWLRTQYLTADPIAKVQLAAANRRIESLRAELETARSSLRQTSESREAASEQNDDLAARNQELANELAEVRRISANAIALDAARTELESKNAALEARVDELTRTVGSLESDVRLRWLLFGGALVLVGIAIGFAFRTRRKRSLFT